jgi:hypothetical protein
MKEDFMRRMKMNKCKTCKNKIESNAKFILEEHTMAGYLPERFCTRNCFVEYVKKKFKLMKW